MPSPHPERTPSWRWLVAFALAILVAHELHEIVHTWTGRALCGAWGTRDFNVWRLAPGCRTWVPTLVGPLFSWAAMWLGVLFIRSGEENRRWVGLALVFAPNPLGRLLPALMGGGDEGVVARAFVGASGPWARLLVAVVSFAVILPPLAVAWRALPVRRRGGWFALLFLAAVLVTGPLLFAVGNRLLAAGVLTAPGAFGAPVLVEVATATFLALFLWRRKDLANAGPAGTSTGDAKASPVRAA